MPWRDRDPTAAHMPAADPWRDLQYGAGNHAVAALAASAGRPLDPDVRAEMQARFGRDLGTVRVHFDSAAAAATLAEGARAYTVGEHIAFGAGRYEPRTGPGRRLLSNELAHVVQQTGGGPAAGGRSASTPASAEAEAQQAGAQVAGDHPVAVRGAAVGVQRDELTDDERRRAAPSVCSSGHCHDPHPAATPSPRSSTPTPTDLAAIRAWLGPLPGATPPAASDRIPPFGGDRSPQLRTMTPPTDVKAPPGIAALGARPRTVHVVELFVPETRFSSPFGAWGGNRVFSQAEVSAEYDVQVDQPDPTAGHNFDTYLWNTTTGKRIPAQHVSGTQYRVLMGTQECPGCHFGQGLVIDLHGKPFPLALGEVGMAAVALSDVAAMAATLRAPRVPSTSTAAGIDEALVAGPGSPKPRTPDDEFREFTEMTRAEGASELTAAGEPVTMQPHGGASQARATLGVTGDNQSMHGLPRSVGKHLPGYDPDAALTTLGEKTMHSELDQPWKDAFQAMRRQGRTTATAQEVYDAIANSIDRSNQLTARMKTTMKLRLHDEMFVEYGLQRAQQLTLPYRNIKPVTPSSPPAPNPGGSQ